MLIFGRRSRISLLVPEAAVVVVSMAAEARGANPAVRGRKGRRGVSMLKVLGGVSISNWRFVAAQGELELEK